MESITIRRAEKADCPRLLELVWELASYEGAFESATLSLDEFANDGFGEHPVWWAFVAEIEGEVQGMALYYVRFSTWNGKQLYLEDLYVSEAWRRHGVGSRLFDRLIEEARSRGIRIIRWQALEWNESALCFYQQQGASFDSGWMNCWLEVEE
jgi:GNAT superfamily N-acetyltransferase